MLLSCPIIEHPGSGAVTAGARLSPPTTTTQRLALKESFRQVLIEATRLTRAGHLREATAVIQRALRSPGPAASASPSPFSSPFPVRSTSAAAPAAEPTTAPAAAAFRDDTDVIDVEARVMQPERPATATAGVEPPSPSATAPVPAPAPAGRFLSGTFTNAAGTRPYKLFVPGTAAAQPRPLLVLLHGCKQNPDDFAAGTRMNELAQSQGWVVLYPGQPNTANGSGCWNWFQPADQQRERGEPAILAGITRHIIASEDIDPQRVYVAGLSAGGAMAAVLAATHPDLFAAVGVHSGLPHRAAHDVMTAFSVMRQGPPYGASLAALPAIVFHGDQDRTVHPSNGEALIAQTGPAGVPSRTAGLPPRVQTGRAPGGHSYTRSIHLDAAGHPQAEHWVVHGAGHAWSGGSAAGSYTDPKGPDASAEMLRFFAAYRVAGGMAADAA